MNKVELKVNVINQLKLLRQSTFKDKLCFLDEDIQNAQRAKAKNVYITEKYNEDKIIIENDGGLLENPQCLFSIAESGWDNEVQKSENPFGMGFFSNITVSNLIEIYSGNKYIVFDIDKMINTGSIEIPIQETNNFYNGFKIVLNNFKFAEVSLSEVKERVQSLGKYIQELDVYYNGKKQEKKDLMEGDNSVFQTQIEEDDFKGWIALGNNYWFNDSLNIFYKGRLICTLPNTPYLKGDIHVNDKALNLTSPDRKDIIRDDKYFIFKNQIKIYIELLCEDALLNGDEVEVERFSSVIGYYIDKSKVKNRINFLTFKTKKDLDYLTDVAGARRKNKNIENFKDFQIYLEKESHIQSESHIEEITIEEQIQNKTPEAKGVIIHESSFHHSDGYIEKPKIEENQTEEKKGEQIIRKNIPVFWMKFDEIEQYEFKFNMINHYNLKLIISRNEIETQILKNMKESDNVLHISELVEEIDCRGYLTNTQLNIKEQRGLMLLNLISRILGANHNIFAIGDLMVTKTVEIDAIDKKYEIIEDDITIIKDSNVGKVYIDRSIIDISDLKESLDIKITLEDYKFILSNLYNVINQSYLLAEGGNTKDKIMEKVLLTLGKGMII
ncbi:TPA: hypothetical protein PTV74_003253 [Clostridium botulinum]|nr:hypothetical protein [Clostridium botulinum]HDK7206407.1 hypothetical protein [Clostridium botulinum]HDK7210143.1 hypothetical protein [Clostridium botulinum]HDK7265592.1 hypothetical protein [Clostridium botulinum]HDK7269440.1 hypothetical protein [Clostridium botulinum]